MSHRTAPAASNPAAAEVTDTDQDSEELATETDGTTLVHATSPIPRKIPKSTLPESSRQPSSGVARRQGGWVIAAIVVGVAVLVTVTASRTASDHETASVQPATEQLAVDSVYEGVWVIQYENGNRLRLTFALLPNRIALKNGQGRGTWDTVDGTAQIVWRDGWRDRIRPSESDRSKFENDAYRPGKTFTDRPDNTATATRRATG